MSTNQPGKPRVKVPGEDIDTTTEAHGIKAGRIEDADTEGHGRRFPSEDESVNRDIDSTEGHRWKGAVEDADTEGHAVKGRP